MSARLAAYSLLLGNFIVGACVTAPAGMLKQLADGLNASVVEVGLLVTWGAVVLCFGSPITASLTSALDRRTLLAGSAGLMAVTNFASAIAPNYETLLIARLVMLVCAAPFTPQAAGTIAMLVPADRRASAISFIFIGWSLSLAIGLPIVGGLADQVGWRWSYAVLGAVATVSAGLILYGVPKGLKGAAMSLKSWGQIFGDRRILLILAVTAVQVSGQFATFTYLGPLLIHYLGATVGMIAVFFAVFGFAGLAGNIAATRIVGMIGPFRTAAVFLATTLLGILIWTLGAGIFGAMLVASAVWGLGFAAINSMQQARLVAAAPPLASGTVALNTSCIYIGQAVGSGLGGILFDRGAFDAIGWMAVIFVLASLGVLALSRGRGETFAFVRA